MNPLDYEKFFGRNPSGELLFTILLIADANEAATDVFVRRVNETGTKKKRDILSQVQSEESKSFKKRGKLILGDDKAYITAIVPKMGKFTPGDFAKTVYYVGWTEDPASEDWVYVDYRIPKPFRKALERFATDLPFEVGSRVPDLTVGVRAGAPVDPLANWILENDRKLRQAMSAALARTGETTLTIV